MRNNAASSGEAPRQLRLAYFVSHPIQYQAPLLRRIAAEPDIDLTVFFFSDISVRGHVDPGFGVRVKWDVPLLSGYKFEFLPRVRDARGLSFARPLNWGFYQKLREGKFDAVWVHGYATLSAIQSILAARMLGIPVLLRAESTLSDRPRSSFTRRSDLRRRRSVRSPAAPTWGGSPCIGIFRMRQPSPERAADTISPCIPRPTLHRGCRSRIPPNGCVQP